MGNEEHCSGCTRNRELIEQLERRVSTLEAEIHVEADIDIELEFEALKKKQDARTAALEEYERLQREEFYRELPELKERAAKRRAAYEAFMRERGFEP